MSTPRERFVLAIAIPVGALLAGAVLVWSISRILLAADERIAPVIGILFALNILTAAGLAATFPRRKGVVLALIVAVAVPAVTAGVVGAVVGERPVHNLVAEEGGGDRGGEEGGGGETAAEIAAENILFTADSLSLAAEAEVTIAFDNRDTGVPHNVAIYTDETATEEIFVGEVFPGPEAMEYTFTSPPAGEYFFRCDVHPTMTGTLTVG